jgi:Fe2+ or Zn2+ uptake regulation protein
MSKAHSEQDTTAEGAVSRLRTLGCRMTRLRVELINRFFALDHPASAQELLSLIPFPVNKTSVYREIEFLADQGIIAQVSTIAGKKVYEVKGKAHHHVVCHQCQRIVCVDLSTNLNSLARRIAGEYNFRVEQQLLEFSGVCGDCSSDPAPAP